VFFIAFSGYFFSWIVAKLIKLKKEDVIALIYAGGMRNIGAGLVIAVFSFQQQLHYSL